MIQLDPKYDPKEVEARWYKTWENKGYFKADPKSAKPAFSLVIPPPNVTGSLHIGHALNNSLQDLLARLMRMQGHDVLWVPGCDHAGIATQNVVERELAKEGKKRDDLGREAFLERVWKWKNESGSTIMRQLRRLGASCDWTYERFTMDEGLSKSVVEVFIQLFEKGLIYQGDYIINWCPRCGTALSDIEAQHKDINGKLYHVRYPVAGQKDKFVVVATTRPETIMGDVAVCVNPKDPRYAALKGAKLTLPVMGREIPLIEDGYVDMAFGTGALKITPAHDLNDFEIGNKFGFERIKIMDPQGVMNDLAGPYAGLDRFAARKKIVADLEEQGLLEKVEDYAHAVARCYRCDTVVESYLSKQWFVKMKPLAEKALAALEKGETVFQPENWKKVYTDWLGNIRDWCVSRQIWWGHRIPVFHAADGRKAAAHSAAEAAKKLGLKESELAQDPDVLDTWFSSGLWPFSTLGWPEKTAELARYYPTSILVTSWDILFFWVARMSMFGLETLGKVPFKEVMINSLVADEHGQKMSKSKGNVVDPLEKIDAIGADALRFALFSIESQARYISLSVERLENGRNFMNKIWNASRFMLMNLEGFEPKAPLSLPKKEGLDLMERWILSRLCLTLAEVKACLAPGKRDVQAASGRLQVFFWNELCDWYIESAKLKLQPGHPERAKAQEVLAFTLETVLRMLHPFCPFITEEVWQRLPHEGETIMLSKWPELPAEYDNQSMWDLSVISDVIHAVRNIRGEMKVDAKKQVSALLADADAGKRALLEGQKPLLESLGQMKILSIGSVVEKPKGAASAVAGSVQVFLPLEGLLDLGAEKQRLEKEVAKFHALVEGVKKKLGNEAFVSKAPHEIVAGEKRRIAEYEETIAKLSQNIKDLGA